VVALVRVSASEEPRTWWGATELARQWRPGVPESAALQVPTPITRDDRVQEVSLKEAIALALANNPGIAARRLEPVRQGATVLQSQAQFDPIFSGELMQRHSSTPNTSSLAGTTTLNVDDRTANFHLFKTFRSGTMTTIDFLNE